MVRVKLSILFGVLLFGCFGNTASAYAKTQVKLRARISSKNQVILTVSVPVRYRSRKTITTIYRSDSPDSLAPVASARARRKRTRFLDSDAPTGQPVSYRAMVKKSALTIWSPQIMVSRSDEPPPAAPPQQESWATRNPGPYGGQSDCPAGFEELVLDFVNQARSSVRALQGNRLLTSAARSHTRDMAQRQVLSHDGWFDYIQASGFQGFTFGENIASGFHSPSEVVQAWLASSGHRANILNPEYSQLGVGCIQDSDGRMWWTQHFGG